MKRNAVSGNIIAQKAHPNDFIEDFLLLVTAIYDLFSSEQKIVQRLLQTSSKPLVAFKQFQVCTE